MRFRRWHWWAVGTMVLVVLVVAGALLVLPAWIRARATAAAAARGLSLSVGRVHPGWFVASLDDASVQLAGVEGVDAKFASVRVALDSRLRPVVLEAIGGRATVAWSERLATELEQWRQRRRAEVRGAGASVDVTLNFEEVVATMPGGARATASAVRLRRDVEQTEVSIGAMDASSGRLSVRVADARIGLAGGVVHDAKLQSAEVVWVDEAATQVADVAAMPVPALPPPIEGPRPPRSKRGATAPTGEPAAPLPRLLPELHDLRAKLVALISALQSRVPEGSNLHVDALSLQLRRGGEELGASGLFDLERAPDRIKLNFSTSPVAHTMPLAIRADLPTGAGDIEVSAAGGPVPLGLLGMHDGGLLHLINVDRTTFGGKGRVVLDSLAQTLTFDVEGSVRNLSVREPRLARDPVVGLDLAVSTRGVIDDKGELRLDEAEASVGAAHATVHGGLAQTADHLAAAFDFDFPTSSCQALLTSIPSALVPTVSAARMDGTFSLRGRLKADSRDLDALAFDYDVSDRCRLVDVPAALDKRRFSREFTHVVYSATGEREERTTGPGSPGWAELDEISPYMQIAVLTTEDAAFFHHHGFNHAAIRHAVAANIKAHRFVRGASTITMQLAKNLFLTREKTLARKLEELVLADYLEQAFTKDEMMELYLNVIEFGPDIYGVGAAADHYFGRKPSELNLAECMFLSSILPNPIAFHKVYDEGKLGEGWMRTIRARMEIARHSGIISAAALAEGLTETVEFHRPGAPPPAPRPPVTTPEHPGTPTDWEELN